MSETGVDLDTIASLCKRRGFIFPSSEIYGGFESTWDYGSLGVELKRNVKAAWWKAMVQERDDIVGIETSILMSPLVWQASGHASHLFLLRKGLSLSKEAWRGRNAAGMM